jgi:hypothetical protein
VVLRVSKEFLGYRSEQEARALLNNFNPTRALRGSAGRAVVLSREGPKYIPRDAGVTLLADLDAFYTEHHRCGDLDAGGEGPVVLFACECGARMVRRVDEPDDARRT